MRVWDLPPAVLCRQHLLGEHREIHCIYSVIASGKTGYAKHPETLRWTGKLPALRIRHDAIAAEMLRRGFKHLTPLDYRRGSAWQDRALLSPARQAALLHAKGCECLVTAGGAR